MGNLEEALRGLINAHSAERESSTPDFILASYLHDCLVSYNRALQARDEWYGESNGN